ncbi:MAG: hypothetical protein IPP85_18920 [Propionivibrio sp.]|nr:hypothetical protein [Propionivibrio sp.]
MIKPFFIILTMMIGFGFRRNDFEDWGVASSADVKFGLIYSGEFRHAGTGSIAGFLSIDRNRIQPNQPSRSTSLAAGHFWSHDRFAVAAADRSGVKPISSR